MRARAGRASGGGPVGVIDIGSNSARLIVYQLEPGGHLRILAGSRAPLRLVRDLDRARRIPADALERAFEALRDFRSIARGSGVRRLLAAGTSAFRDASNGEAFVRRVRRELGIVIRVLSGVEEARYGFLGAGGGLPVRNGVQFDLGGGSLQMARFHDRRLLGAVSVPLGALRVSDGFLRADPPTSREVRRLREHARSVLGDAGLVPLGAGERLVGTGGTLRNIARIDQRATGYPISRLHGFTLSRRRLREIDADLLALRLKRRGRTSGLNQDRRDSVVGGGLVIETLMDVLGARELLVSGQGVREGLALGLLTQDLEAPETVRAGSLEALARRFAGWSADRAHRREALAAALHSGLERFPAPEMEEALAQAARILDVGRTVDFFDRHEHVADLVLATDLAGFTHRQVALLSAVLRRAGDEDARPRSYAPLIGREDRPSLERGAVILALADEITERCPPRSAPVVRCRSRRGEAVVEVPALASWRVRGLGERFERAFGRRLRVVPGAFRARPSRFLSASSRRTRGWPGRERRRPRGRGSRASARGRS
jgi:exopolyphosphatase/guanosine-5'-triphosphate,3'-diphosphate pyrophosphatase